MERRGGKSEQRESGILVLRPALLLTCCFSLGKQHHAGSPSALDLLGLFRWSAIWAKISCLFSGPSILFAILGATAIQVTAEERHQFRTV